MVQSRKKRKDKKKLLGSHQRSWIWGRHAVCEILEAGRWPMSELYLSDQLDPGEQQDAKIQADALGYMVRIESPDRIHELCKTGEHQGYLAKMLDYPYADLEEILAKLQTNTKTNPIPIFVMLDGIQDPYNFGAIVRSAEVLGINGFVISDTNQVGVTSMVARSSAGAVNHLPIVRTENLLAAIETLKKSGVSVIGASEKGATPLDEHNFDSPTLLILGNEGSGICEDLLKQCDTRLSIAQTGKVGSLNVAAAAAILFHEARRPRG
ncbi:MAG: 23S rRNA (guanosine(2251)-2'-O)-methyltransferase RlmB [Candidatus Hydrogenedentota bacterium]